MKKLTFIVFVSIALWSLGMASCGSIPIPRELDLSTIDRSKPVPVGLISISFVNTDPKFPEFLNKYGDIRKTSDQLEKADLDLLLELLCGTVSKNWEFITKHVKAEMGITLNRDLFMQDLKNGDTSKIASMKNGPWGYYYSWNGQYLESPIALISVTFKNGKMVPLGVTIQAWDDNELQDSTVNVRQARIMLPR
jgi:hypothetical protein